MKVTVPTIATDEIGNPLSINLAIDLGAIQIPTPSPPSPPSPPPTSPLTLSVFQAAVQITIDLDALYLQSFPPALALLDAISEELLGQSLPPVADLVPIIEADVVALLKDFGVV